MIKMVTRESGAQIDEILGALGKNPRKVLGGSLRCGLIEGAVDSKMAFPLAINRGFPKGPAPATRTTSPPGPATGRGGEKIKMVTRESGAQIDEILGALGKNPPKMHCGSVRHSPTG
jgi:hypothetical protein